MAEHFGRFVKTAVFLSRGTIWGMFFSRKLLSAISLIGDGSSPFCAISSGNCLKGCVCVESNILGRNLFFQKVMRKNSGKCAKRFSDSSQINSPGMSKMLSACPVSSKFWGVFLEKECFFHHFWTFSKRVEAVWQKYFEQCFKVEFHVSKTINSTFEFVGEKKRNIPLFHRQWAEKVSDGSVKFQRGLSNLLFNCPVEQFKGKIPVFVFHEFQTLGKYPSTVWWNESEKVAEAVIHVSGGNFLGEFCRKVSGLFLLFRTVSKKLICLFAFFWQVFQSSFLLIDKEIVWPFSWRKCGFPISPDLEWKPWNSLANYSGNFVKTAFYIPVHFFVKKPFFKVARIIVSGHLLETFGAFGGKILAFYYVFRIFDKNVFDVSSGTSKESFPRNNELFPFCKIESWRMGPLAEFFGRFVKTAVFLSRGQFWGSLFIKKFVCNNLFTWRWKFTFLWDFFRKLFERVSLRRK